MNLDVVSPEINIKLNANNNNNINNNKRQLSLSSYYKPKGCLTTCILTFNLNEFME